MNSIRYQYGNDLDLDQVIELYNASTLGERRPVDDRQVMSDMLRHANLVVTAWDGNLLVGIARTLTDFSYVGYLSDLAVKASHQRHRSRCSSCWRRRKPSSIIPKSASLGTTAPGPSTPKLPSRTAIPSKGA
jgi:hypothetical protein